VFHGPRGGLLKADTLRVVLRRDVLAPLAERFPAAAGETGFADGRLHSFRHYFVSKCARDGVPEQTVMRWVGHQDSNIVRRYFHLHDETAQQQMGRVRGILSPGSRGRGGRRLPAEKGKAAKLAS
jgi:integrase